MDTSFLVGNAPQPLLNPLDIQARKIAVRNALAAGAMQDQQIQAATLGNQQTQQAITDQRNLRAAMTQMYGGQPGAAPDPSAAPVAASLPAAAPAMAPAPNVSAGVPPGGAALPPAPAFNPSANGLAPTGPTPGAPPAGPMGGAAPAPAAAPAPIARPAVPTMQQLIGLKVAPGDAAGLISKFQEIDKNAAGIDNQRATTAGLVQDQIANVANAAVQAKMNPAVVSGLLQHFASMGPEYAQMAAQVQQHLQGLSPADQLAYATGLANQGTKTITANAAATTAAKAQDAATLKAKADAELFDKKKADLSAQLGAATNQTDWQNSISKADPAVVAAMNIAPSFSKANQAAAVAQGQSSNEQVTTGQTAAHNAATEANETRRANEEQQNINLRQKAFNQQYGDPTAGASPSEIITAKARAAGTLALPNPRSKGYDREIALAAAQDPTFAQYASTRADTIKNFKEKGDSDDVVALATALEHLQRAKTNSASMGFEPTLGTNMFPTQHAYHQDVYNLTDEVGKLIKHGAMTEAETNRGINNLASSFQGNRDAGLDELTNLMGGKVAAKIQKYIAGTGQLVPASLFDAATQSRLKAAGFAKGIDWNAQAGPAAPAAPAAAAPAVDPLAQARADIAKYSK